MNDSGLKPGEKFLLTVREASEYFNIGIKQMRRIAEDNEGGFAVFRGNRFLIIRPRFEEYILEQAERKADKNEENT